MSRTVTRCRRLTATVILGDGEFCLTSPRDTATPGRAPIRWFPSAPVPFRPQTWTRLGGIYALEGVMNDSEQYYRSVLEALSAFVREGTKCQSDANRDTKPNPCSGVAPATDIQAAVTVIGRRVARVRGPVP